MNYITDSWIGGKFVAGDSGESLDVLDKYSGVCMASVPLAGGKQVESAICAAVDGFQSFRKFKPEKRADILLQLKSLLTESHDFFSRLISSEAGKPIDLAKAEVDRGLNTLEIAALEAPRLADEAVDLGLGVGGRRKAFTRPFPIGVVSCITPFNFPLNLALHKIAPCIAAGNSFVLKPAHQAPLTMLAFAGLIARTDIPPGVANILLCDIPDAAPLIEDERIALLSFTGSATVGWKLKNAAGKKKVTLELGGNAGVIIDESADLDQALKEIIPSAFGYAGQVCISAQRIFVCSKVQDSFREKLIRAISEISVGDPGLVGVLCGPVIDRENLRRISDWVNEAVQSGAVILAGGKILDEQKKLYAPTLISGTRKGLKVLDEEVFGPVLVFETVSDIQEGISRLNDSKYGLQASLYSNDPDAINAAIEQCEVGGLIINGPPSFRMDSMPYGGIKNSGTGKEGVRYAIAEMVERKLVVL